MVGRTSRDYRGRRDSSDEGPGEAVLPDSHGQDRQVLVVGDGFIAGVTAGFLAQAGLDPVLAPPANGRTPQLLKVLWRPGLALLERIGLRRPVERVGTPLDGLDCQTADRSWTDGTRTSLVAVGRQQLSELVDRQLLGDIRTSPRPVTELEPAGAGVRSRFDHGIDERFDAAVTTTRTLVPCRTAAAEQTVQTWEFERPARRTTVPTEAWAGGRAAFTVPLDETVGVQLVSSTETAPAAAVSVEEVAAVFGSLFEDRQPFEGVDGARVQYSRESCAVQRSVHTESVALVGPEARASLPGDCLSVTRSIEDAWILADALAYGPPAVDDALAAYSKRRRLRERDLLTASVGTPPTTGAPADCSPTLRYLAASRALAFSHVRGHSLPDRLLSVPRRL